MEPWFSQSDKIMFYKYLDKATVYFEYGSGGSTYQANIRKNISKIYSVESDIEWLNKLKHKINSDKLVLFYNEMDVRPNTLGYPGKDSIPIQLINYSNQILNISKDEQQKIDLLLIDGRFRVACCLKLFDIIGSDCLIAFDDFLNRKEYHIVLDYYNIIEKTVDQRMVILQKKKGIISIPEDIIKKYELISK
jgi:protein O-GlcNAc transferase